MEKKELRKKVKEFAEGAAGYKRARRLVWTCGIGLWALACIVSLVVFDIHSRSAFDNATNGEELVLAVAEAAMLTYAFGVAIIAFGVIILVICIITHIIKSKLREKMTIFVKGMKADGYSKEEIGRSLLTDFSELDVWKCLESVFGKEKEKK